MECLEDCEVIVFSFFSFLLAVPRVRRTLQKTEKSDPIEDRRMREGDPFTHRPHLREGMSHPSG